MWDPIKYIYRPQNFWLFDQKSHCYHQCTLRLLLVRKTSFGNERKTLCWSWCYSKGFDRHTQRHTEKSHSIIFLIVQIVVFSAKGTVSKATNKMFAKETQFFVFVIKSWNFWIPPCIHVRPSVFHVQTKFLGHHKSHRLQIWIDTQSMCGQNAIT